MSHEYAHKLQRDMEHGPTCTLEQFEQAQADNSNFEWMIDRGHIHNLLEEALGEIARLKTEAARDKGNRKHIWRQGYSAGWRQGYSAAKGSA